MRTKKAIFAIALAAAAFAVDSIPASAVTLPPPGQEYLIVFAYYSEPAKTHIVGQTWHGCPNQPAGAWGSKTQWYNVFFTPC